MGYALTIIVKDWRPRGFRLGPEHCTKKCTSAQQGASGEPRVALEDMSLVTAVGVVLSQARH